MLEDRQLKHMWNLYGDAILWACSDVWTMCLRPCRGLVWTFNMPAHKKNVTCIGVLLKWQVPGTSIEISMKTAFAFQDGTHYLYDIILYLKGSYSHCAKIHVDILFSCDSLQDKCLCWDHQHWHMWMTVNLPVLSVQKWGGTYTLTMLDTIYPCFRHYLSICYTNVEVQNWQQFVLISHKSTT